MERIAQLLLQVAHLRDTMLPSSAGRLLILLDDRSKNTRLCSLAISGGTRDRELSLRCKAVRCVSDQRPELRLRTLPETETDININKKKISFFNMFDFHRRSDLKLVDLNRYLSEGLIQDTYQLFQAHPKWIFSHCLPPHWTL